MWVQTNTYRGVPIYVRGVGSSYDDDPLLTTISECYINEGSSSPYKLLLYTGFFTNDYNGYCLLENINALGKMQITVSNFSELNGVYEQIVTPETRKPKLYNPNNGYYYDGSLSFSKSGLFLGGQKITETESGYILPNEFSFSEPNVYYTDSNFTKVSTIPRATTNDRYTDEAFEYTRRPYAKITKTMVDYPYATQNLDDPFRKGSDELSFRLGYLRFKGTYQDTYYGYTERIYPYMIKNKDIVFDASRSLWYFIYENYIYYGEEPLEGVTRVFEVDEEAQPQPPYSPKPPITLTFLDRTHVKQQRKILPNMRDLSDGY